MATRKDGHRKNMMWVHSTSEFNYRVVKVVNDIIYTTRLYENGCALYKHVVQLSQGFSLVLLDGIGNEVISLIVRFCRRENDAIIISCTSYKSGNFSGSQECFLRHFDMAYTMYSWTLEDYKAACKANIFSYISSAYELVAHYYYSGGCLRYMIEQMMNVLETLHINLAGVSDFSLLLQGLIGVQAPTALNSLVQVRSDEFGTEIVGIFSEYVTKKLAGYIFDHFIARAKIVYSKNPECLGWIF